MSRWLPSGGDARRSRTVARALLLAGLVYLGICGRSFLGQARGQGAPQPVPVPISHLWPELLVVLALLALGAGVAWLLSREED